MRVAFYAFENEGTDIDLFMKKHAQTLYLSEEVINAWNENIALEESFDLKSSLENSGFRLAEGEKDIISFTNDKFLVLLYNNSGESEDGEDIEFMAIRSFSFNNFVYYGRIPETNSEFEFLFAMLNIN